MDIWSLGLSPQEFMTFLYLVDRRGRVTGVEAGEVMGTSEVTGRRTLSQLERRGLIRRISRGHFEVDERSLVNAERSLVNETFSVLLTTSSTAYMRLEVPNGTSSRGAAGAREQFEINRGIEMVVPGRLSDEDPSGSADDLSEERPRRKLPSKFHRRDDPIETWTVAHVVKEFQIRIYQALPDYLFPVDGRELAQVLGRLHRQNGVSIQEMLAAMESYFAYEVQRVPRDKSPMGHFLHHLDSQRRQELSNAPEVMDADYIAQFNGDW